MDTDEYMSFNYYDKNAAKKKTFDVPCEAENRVVNITCRRDASPVNVMQLFGLEFPSELGGATGTIGRFIYDQYMNNAQLSNARNNSHVCELLPRPQVASTLETLPPWQNDLNAMLPNDFDSALFRTYKNHEIQRLKMAGKALLNIRYWNGDPVTIHRGPEGANCFNSEGYFPDPSLALFRVNHYKGSLEEYLSRTMDTRRRAEFHANVYPQLPTSQVVDTAALRWLPNFIARVGPRRALYLTQGLRAWSHEQFVSMSNSSAASRSAS